MLGAFVDLFGWGEWLVRCWCIPWPKLLCNLLNVLFRRGTVTSCAILLGLSTCAVIATCMFTPPFVEP